MDQHIFKNTAEVGSWLLKDPEGGAKVADVEYAGVVLCPATANKAWGAFLEKRMVQIDQRSRDLGVANVTGAKVRAGRRGCALVFG